MTKLFSFISVFFLFISGAFSQGYNISIKINGLKPNDVYFLSGYYVNKYLKVDSAISRKNGLVVFKGENKLPNGIYTIGTTKQKYFEMVVSQQEQDFSIETDTLFETNNFVVRNSKENMAFFEFQTFSKQISLEYEVTKSQMAFARHHKDSLALKKQFENLDSQIQSKRKEIANRNPGLFITKVFRCFEEKDELMLLSKSNIINYHKDHYWDNIDLSEEGLLRTPVFHNKLKIFFTHTIVQIPDSIIKESDKLLNTMEVFGKNELYKYTVTWITNYYVESCSTEMTKVYHYMTTNYYCSGKTPWIDSLTLEKLCER
jgi:hypothetical protein